MILRYTSGSSAVGISTCIFFSVPSSCIHARALFGIASAILVLIFLFLFISFLWFFLFSVSFSFFAKTLPGVTGALQAVTAALPFSVTAAGAAAGSMRACAVSARAVTPLSVTVSALQVTFFALPVMVTALHALGFSLPVAACGSPAVVAVAFSFFRSRQRRTRFRVSIRWYSRLMASSSKAGRPVWAVVSSMAVFCGSREKGGKPPCRAASYNSCNHSITFSISFRSWLIKLISIT